MILRMLTTLVRLFFYQILNSIGWFKNYGNIYNNKFSVLRSESKCISKQFCKLYLIFHDDKVCNTNQGIADLFADFLKFKCEVADCLSVSNSR